MLTPWWFSDKREQTRDVLLVSSGSVNGLNLQSRRAIAASLLEKVASIDLDPADPHNLLVTAHSRRFC